MWNIMFIILFIFAVVMLIFSVVYEKNYYWNLVGAALSSFTFLILALSQMELQFPYQFIVSNNTTVVTGVHTYTDPISPYLTYYFFGLFAITQIYLWSIVWDWKTN